MFIIYPNEFLPLTGLTIVNKQLVNKFSNSDDKNLNLKTYSEAKKKKKYGKSSECIQNAYWTVLPGCQAMIVRKVLKLRN